MSQPVTLNGLGHNASATSPCASGARGVRERTTGITRGGLKTRIPGDSQPLPILGEGPYGHPTRSFDRPGVLFGRKAAGGPCRGWWWTARPVGPVDAAATVENAWRLEPGPAIIEVARTPVRRFPQSLGKRFAFPTSVHRPNLLTVMGEIQDQEEHSYARLWKTPPVGRSPVPEVVPPACLSACNGRRRFPQPPWKHLLVGPEMGLN